MDQWTLVIILMQEDLGAYKNGWRRARSAPYET